MGGQGAARVAAMIDRWIAQLGTMHIALVFAAILIRISREFGSILHDDVSVKEWR